MNFSLRKKILVCGFFILGAKFSYAQLSPPGLGDANTASWLAFGLQHKIDSTGAKYGVAYVGMGRKSDPTNDNPFGKPAIGVLNYEIYNKFQSNQQYSYALSYRRSTEYSDQEPYHKAGLEQEFRVYGRYAYTASFGKFQLKNTVRQEFRKFFDADFNAVDENFQLRTRLKTQLSYPISPTNNQSLSLSAEAIFSTSYMNHVEKHWTDLKYKELRLALYYSNELPNSPATLNIGYMNNLIDGNTRAKWGVHYLAVDLIWKL